MIARLNGTVVTKLPPNQVIIEVNGVGYEVEVSVSTFTQLCLDRSAILLIQTIIREDAHILFGFFDQEEKQLFKQLIKVSGIGPKTAINILSGLPVAELVQAIETASVTRLSKLPGIGKKTAERLILELSGKVSSSHQARIENDPDRNAFDDAVAALSVLGYKPVDAEKMVKKVMRPALSVDDLIRQALQHSMS